MDQYLKVCQCFGRGLVFLLLSSCVEPFEPKLTQKDTNFLVVDGGINTEGITTIKLSRTTGLAQNAIAAVETKARLFIEEESGRQYPLTESPAGTYRSAALSLAKEKQVRLHFTTARGQEYTSEYTPAIRTPVIDEVSWRPTDQGLQIAVNAHDDTHTVRYYRWSYDETWEFTSAFRSYLEYKNGKVVDRLENTYNCWGSEAPTAIKLGTTVKLAQDVISQQPLTLLPPNSVRLRYKYSILVKQYALTAEEYNYWEALRKNTESIGTLFDPLPTQLTGNVHNVADRDEAVIGFVGAQSVQQQRIFIERSQLPADWKFTTGNEGCQIDTIPRPMAPPPTPEEILGFFSRGEVVPIDFNKERNHYYVSTPVCVDCRKRGTNVRPSFWQ